MGQDIKQTVTFDARPGVIFELLMDQRKHSAFSGMPAKISRKPGGAFTCYGGHLEGFTVETVNNKRIVQAWRAAGWPKGVWSVATFNLAGAPGGKSKLSFSQMGVPAKSLKGITAGWKSHYWTPIKVHLKAEKAAKKKK